MLKNKVLMLPASSDTDVMEFLTDSEFLLEPHRLTFVNDKGERLPLLIKEHSIILKNLFGGKTVFVNLRSDLTLPEMEFLTGCGQLRKQE